MEFNRRINRKIRQIMGKNTITDELIEKKMIAKGYGELDSHDEEKIRQSVLDHYNIELTTDWSDHHDFYMYEESTADGYTVFIATSDYRNIQIGDNVHYYDHSLFGELVDFVKYSDGGETIYVDDLYQDYIDDACIDLYEDLCKKFHEEAIDELIDEGYEQEMIEDLMSNRI